jgi:peptidoglycan hydrolase-like protein with peptidoglycan-binding domain
LGNGYPDPNTADPKTASDGWFGPGTETATKKFQREAGEVVDGVIGQQTWTALLGQ